MRYHRSQFGAELLMLLFTAQALAQDIEPRRWTHLPVGINVLGAGAVYIYGNVALTRCSSSKMSGSRPKR